MKTKSLVSLLTVASSAIALAEPAKEASQLQIYPKNLARQHLGANLFKFNPTTQTYAPTEAAAAWLDDDISTGWPMLAGKQYYLLALPQAELLTNFSLSTRPAAGSITLYAGDDPAPPGAKSWKVIGKDLPLEKVNEHKLTKPFSRLAKYVLIETNVEDPGPVFSLFLYGDKPAVAFESRKREQGIDSRAIFGPYANEQTSFNVAGLYSKGVVSYANAETGFVSWQKAIDDNPESALTLTPSGDQSSATIKYNEPRSVSRIALLANAGAKGRLDFYLADQEGESGTAAPAATPIGERTPAASITLDGTNARSAVDFPQAQGSEMLVRWTPANGTDSVNIRELNAFGGPTLSTYAVTMKPEAVAEFGGDRMADASKDGKSFKDVKDIKEAVDAAEPIGEFLPQRGPYLPGALGFPPNLTSRRPNVVLPPNQPPVQPPEEPPVSP